MLCLVRFLHSDLFSASVGCCSNEAFCLHGQVSLFLTLFVEEALEENTLGCFCTECLLESEDWNSKLFHGWKRKLRRLEMLQILWAWATFQNCLRGGSVTANTLLTLLPQMGRTNSLHWLENLWWGHILPAPGLDIQCPAKAPQDLKWHMPWDARAVTGRQTGWLTHKTPTVLISYR